MSARAAEGRARFDYTRGSVAGGLARLALPQSIELIAWNFENVSELFWVGRLGSEKLAALSIAYIMLWLPRSFGLGFLIAGNALVAQKIGAGDEEGASLLAGQTAFVSIVFSLAVSVPGVWFAADIMRLVTSDPEIVRGGADYLLVGFAVFIIPTGCFMLGLLFRGAGDAMLSSLGMVASSVVVVILMPILILGAGPVPGLGIFGAGLSGGLGRLAGLLVLLYFMFTGRSRLQIRLRHLRPRLPLLLQVVRLSWPISVQQSLERGANLVLARIISPFGASALAAWGVGVRVITMLRLPGFVMQGAARTMVGQNVGAGLPGRVLKSTMLSLGTVAFLMVFLTFFLFTWAEPVVRFFGMEGEAARVGVICLRILSLGMGFEACRRPLAGAFQGMGIPKPPMLVEAFFRWVVQLPAALLAAYPLGFAEVGVWWAVTGSETLAGAFLFFWFLLGRSWTHLRPRAEDPAPEREEAR